MTARIGWGWGHGASCERSLPPYTLIKLLAQKLSFRGVIVRLAAGIEDQHLAPQPCTSLPFLTRRTRKLTDIFAWVSLA